MSEQNMDIEGRMKVYGGFIRLMAWSGAATAIALLLMWWGLV